MSARTIYVKVAQILADHEYGKTYAKISIQIGEFLERSVPDFITGKKDPYNDADWQAFVKAANKYNSTTVTSMLQELLDNLNK